MPIECFPLNSDLNGSKSRVDKHHLSLSFFLSSFAISLSFFFLLIYLLTILLAVVVQPCIE